MRRALTWLLLSATLVAGPARALTLERIEARYERGVYRVSLQAVLAATPEAIVAVLSDYRDYPSLDRRIRSSEEVDAPGGVVLVRTLIHACAGFFCRNVQRVERIDRTPDGIVATVVPEQSDVRHGVARTRWQVRDGGTWVSYEAEFEPGFWVPAIVGRTLALDSLRASTLELFGNLEARAHGR